MLNGIHGTTVERMRKTEQAAQKALAALKSMSTEVLAEEVMSNSQSPLAVAMRELACFNTQALQSKTELSEKNEKNTRVLKK